MLARQWEMTCFRPRQRNACRWYLESAIESWADWRRLRKRWYARHRPSGQPRVTEAERLKKLVEWTLHVNGWDDPWHTFTYQAAPDGG
jgi:hypothetical protein